MQRRITRIWRHPAVTFVWAPLFLAVFWVSLGKIVEVSQLEASGDPGQIADWGLTHKVSRNDFEREIRSTLAEGKVDLAQGILTEALKHKVPIDAALIDSVQEASVKQASAAVRTARAVTVGLLTGEATDAGGLAGAMAGDAVFLGDLRDLGREGFNCLSGQRCDLWTLGLATCGLAVTLLAYGTGGAAAPERAGLSLLKALRRLGRLNPLLEWRITAAVVEDGSVLIELAGNIGAIETNAGAEGVLDGLAFAATPEDIALLSRLAVAKGREMRVALRLLGRGAYRAGKKIGEEFIEQLFWLALSFLGLAASLKSAAERMMERHLMRQKLRRAREGLTKLA